MNSNIMGREDLLKDLNTSRTDLAKLNAHIDILIARVRNAANMKIDANHIQQEINSLTKLRDIQLKNIERIEADINKSIIGAIHHICV